MCKLLIGKNDTPNNEQFAQVVTAQFEDMRNQPSGIGAVIVTFDGNMKILRNFFDYDEIYDEIKSLLPQTKLIGLHTRISTGCTVGLENVHFFESKGYLLAHNGIIPQFNLTTANHYLEEPGNEELSWFEETERCNGCKTSKNHLCKRHSKFELTTTKTGIPCDSLQFLRAIPKPVSVGGLRTFAEETRMNGMMVMIEKATQRTFVSISKTKNVYCLSDERSFGVFFSWKPEVKAKKTIWTSINNIPVIQEEEETKINLPILDVSVGTFELI